MSNSTKNRSKKPVSKTTEIVRDITPEERHEMISEAAYYLAEQRGFREGCQMYDWLKAEARIDHVFGKTE